MNTQSRPAVTRRPTAGNGRRLPGLPRLAAANFSPRDLSSLDARVYWRRAVDFVRRVASFFHRKPPQYAGGYIPQCSPCVDVYLRCRSVEMITGEPSHAAVNDG